MSFICLLMGLLAVIYCFEASCDGIEGIKVNGPLAQNKKLSREACCSYCNEEMPFKNQRTSILSSEKPDIEEFYNPVCDCNDYRMVLVDNCNCLLATHELAHGGAGYNHIYNYYRPLESNSSYVSLYDTASISVVYRTETSLANDTSSFYAIDDLNRPTIKSGRLYISSLEETEEEMGVQRKLLYHEFTKIENSIHQIHNTSNTPTIHMYRVNLKTADFIDKPQKNISLVLVHATQTYITLNLLVKDVNIVLNKSCRLIIQQNTPYTKTNLFHATLLLTPDVKCSADIQDLSIAIQPDYNLQIIKYDFAERSVEPNNVTHSSRITIFKFDRLFIQSKIQLKLVVAPMNNSNYKLSKFALLLGIIKAKVRVNNDWFNVSRELLWKSFLSNVEQKTSFNIMDGETGFCLQYYNDQIRASKTCSPFLYTNKTLKYDDENCVSVDSNNQLMLNHCDRAASIDIVDGNLYHEQSGSFLKRQALYRGSQFEFSSAAISNIRLEKVFNVGLQIKPGPATKSLHKLCQSWENVSILIDSSDNVFYCSYSGATSNCFKKGINSGVLEFYPRQMCLILGVNANYSFVYGLNVKNELVWYDKNTRMMYAVSTQRWQNNSTLTSHIYRRSDLLRASINTTINEIEYSITYYGLERVSDHFKVMFWSRENCQKDVARTTSASMASCSDIKQYCPSAESGWYWLHGRAGSHVLQGYCEMNTDGGGWLLFVNYTLADGQHFVIDKTEDLNEMLKPLSYPTSKVGFQKLVDWYVPYTSMRFYCFTDKPGRTLHFKTLGNSIATSEGVTKFITNVENLEACSSFQVFQDGASKIGSGCQHWVLKDAGISWWGDAVERDQRLYVLPFQLSKAQWNFGHGESSVCDSLQSDYNYGEWKIFLR